MGVCLNRLLHGMLERFTNENETIIKSKYSVTPKYTESLEITKEQKTVQPRPSISRSSRGSVSTVSPTSRGSVSTVSRGSVSTTSRGSIKSEQYIEPDTSSISARSDTSVDSLVFDPSFGVIRPDLYPKKDAVLQQSSVDRGFGRLHLRLKYDFRTSDIVVHLIEAQDLPAISSVDRDEVFGDPYIRICIIPEVDERIRQSSVKRRTANPFYNEYFKFPVTYDDIRDKTLLFHVYDYDKFSRHKVLGEVQVDLSKVDVSNSVEMWCDIQKQQKMSGDRGDLLLSLSYLPTAERLTVVLLKAKELRVSSTTPSSDPYVRVTIMVEGKKVKRKKTTVQKNTVNPVWNEALSFNVPAEVLPKVSLDCCVIDHDLIGHGEYVGRCILGPDRQGIEAAHWNDMMQNHRKSMAMWQHLHR